MANIAGLKADLLTFFSNTVHLTAQEKVKLRDSYIAHFSGEWQAYLAGGGTDTPANRNQFTANKMIDQWRDIYRDQDRVLKVAAIVPETLG